MLARLDELTWLDPWFLAIVPFALLLGVWRLRRPRAALPTASLALLDTLPRTLRSRLVHLPLALLVSGVAGLGVAMARPVAREALPMRELGVDILLLMDVSSSMQEPDMDDRGQMRIEAARERALEFAASRRNDRVGLMTFALYPELRCPLTLDEAALAAFLRSAETVRRGGEEDGTAIGVGLARAVSFLEKSEATSKVVVLLTDGANTVQDIMPQDAAKLAKDAGVRVHTIGLGQDQVIDTLFGRQRMATDFGDLVKIAENTGGGFFRAHDARDLGLVYSKIDQMEKVELEDPRYRTKDRFLLPLLLGVGLLLASLLLDLLWIRGAP